jgi:hypothetical protein
VTSLPWHWTCQAGWTPILGSSFWRGSPKRPKPKSIKVKARQTWRPERYLSVLRITLSPEARLLCPK